VRSILLVCLLGLPLFGALTACDDPLARQPVLLLRDTVVIGVPVEDRELASAIDMVRERAFGVLRFPERPEHALEWDFALRRAEGGLALRALSPGAGQARPGLAATGEAFEAMRLAPTGGARYTSDLVPLVEGQSFYMRSRQYISPFGNLCVKFGKVQVLTLDVAAGTAELELVINDSCFDERLVPLS
jgi:hypothetical protein